MADVDWRDLSPVPEDERPQLPDDWRPSQTFLKHHDLCDRAAMLYLKHRAGAGSHELNRGAIFHDVVANLTKRALHHGESWEQQGDAEGARTIHHTAHRIPPEFGKDELLAYMRENSHLQVNAAERDALRYMVSNWCMGTWIDVKKTIAVETTLTLEIGDFTITGRVDLAEELDGRTIEVTDYKTSFNMPDSEEWREQAFDEEGNPRFAGDFQTQLYALMLAEGTLDDGMRLGDGYDRFKLTLKFPRYLYPEGLGERSITVTRQQLLDFRLDVELQLERLRDVNLGEGKWQPTPGTHCRECPVSYECPLPRLLRPESQHADLDTLEDLEKAGVAWLFMSSRAANLKSRLKKAAERIGDRDPALLELPDGDKGVRIGSDIGLVFVPRDREEIRDKTRLREAIDETVQYGVEFDWTKHVRTLQGTSFEKRRIAKSNG